MQKRKLGKSSLEVSSPGLGCTGKGFSCGPLSGFRRGQKRWLTKALTLVRVASIDAPA